MKTIFPLLLIFCVAIFSSCTEELEPTTQTKISPADYLKNLDQSIIFQYIQLDENEEWESGWVIDYVGNVHEFNIEGNLARNQENMDCPGTFVMESLLNYSDGIIGEVDIEQLAAYHKKLQVIKNAGVATSNVENPANFAYYGLNKQKAQNHYVNNSECDGDGSTTYRFHEVNYITLEKSTAVREVSNSADALEIRDWMQRLAQEL